MLSQSHIAHEPLSGHRLFQSRDLDDARALVAGKFCQHHLSADRGFDACHNHAGGTAVSLNYLRYGSQVRIDPGELTHFYLVQIPLSGGAQIRNGSRQVTSTRHTASVLNPTWATKMQWYQGCEMLLVQISRSALHQLAEDMSGHVLHQPVVFDPKVELHRPALRQWLDQVSNSLNAAEAGRAFGQANYRFQPVIEEELITGFLLAQPNSASPLLTTKSPGLASVRRARDHIHAHLADPMRLSDLAGVADCSVRSLQLGFQTHLGCAPKQYIQDQRLRLARCHLQSLPEDTKVSDVAWDVGFTHLGRFSQAYKAAFGESPSTTLALGQFRD